MCRDGQRVDEDDIISRILHFDEFDCFYQTEWVPRKISIDWIIDPTCPMYAMQSIDENKKPFIVIRQLPDTIDDAFLVAHEMGHVIKYFDKQYMEFMRAPTPIAKMYKEEEIKDMGNILGSMVDDPLIDSWLQDKYGFSPAHFYSSVLMPGTFESLDSYGDPPYEWHIFKKALYYSQLSLQMESIRDKDTLREWDRLKERYRTRRPKVTRIGEELYSLSRERGFDSIEKQRQLFSEILNRYRINSIKLGDILHMK
ncbi:MAG: hypothetical protein A4E48_02748 [Methanosaeta sp. PtaU1.Bin060]|nr:MAG: hypothetical protein A4E48_02748 [Methanosaeta sp. PtaU1.Bin060]